MSAVQIVTRYAASWQESENTERRWIASSKSGFSGIKTSTDDMHLYKTEEAAKRAVHRQIAAVGGFGFVVLVDCQTIESTTQKVTWSKL